MPRGYRFLVTAACGLTALATIGTGAYFGSLYAPDHKQYQAVAGDQSGNKDYHGPSQSLPDIAGLPGPVERAIANPHPATGEDHEIRDLAAQEASALWAFWMVVISFASVLITAVGTIFLYKQIVLTREAVEDTGKATLAMDRQNAIAEAAQRAWISVEITVPEFWIAYEKINFRYKITCKNIGNTIADNFFNVVSFKFSNTIPLDEIRVDHKVWRDIKLLDEIALMPNEEQVNEGEISYEISDLTWGGSPGNEFTNFIINTGAFYTVHGRDLAGVMNMTTRAVRIGVVSGKDKLLTFPRAYLTPGSLKVCTLPIGIHITT